MGSMELDVRKELSSDTMQSPSQMRAGSNEQHRGKMILRGIKLLTVAANVMMFATCWALFYQERREGIQANVTLPPRSAPTKPDGRYLRRQALISSALARAVQQTEYTLVLTQRWHHSHCHREGMVALR